MERDECVKEKLATPTKILCKGLPEEFIRYLDYTRSLDFAAGPDYEYLRKMFKDLFVREGLLDDYKLDWAVRKDGMTQMIPYLGQVENGIFLQPQTRSISPQDLHGIAKATYASIKRAELKWREFTDDLLASPEERINDEQWQSLLYLYRIYLHQCYDFFMACQHPLATPTTCKLALLYVMPEQLWCSIHSIAGFFSSRLPDSHDHMLAFLYPTYKLMTVLFEKVPAFKKIWAQCLGDLSMYLMVADNVQNQEVWPRVAKQWHQIASPLWSLPNMVGYLETVLLLYEHRHMTNSPPGFPTS